MFSVAELQDSREAEHIMGMRARQDTRSWTEAEFYAARDLAPAGERWELVDGELLVTPSPHWTHQDIATQLLLRLEPFVRAHQLGKIFVAPLDVKLQPGLVLQPDILVVPAGELRKRSDVVTRLLLAVEVTSPGSARFDRVKKRPAYQRSRVPEYWIVDPEAEMIERWRPDDDRPEPLVHRLEWRPLGATDVFALDVEEFFASVRPED
jgi:Uma2 family endonuclease